MQLMQWTFQVLTICGCWRPRSWTSTYKKLLYTVYTVFLFTLLNTMLLLQIMDMLLNVENQEELSEAVYMMLAVLVSCHKMYTVLSSHKKIVALTRILENEPFLPEDQEEEEIRKKFDNIAQKQAYIFTTVVELGVIFQSCTGALNVEGQKLPFRMWLPRKHLSLTMLIVAYIQQAAVLIAGSLVHIGCDNLIWGLLIHICCQIDILEYRLKAIKPGENQAAKSSARYHDLVYRFAKMINEEFQMVILVQFAVTTMIVCFNLYLLLTTRNMDRQFLLVMLYTCSMLTQIFMYCWHGTKVKIKSLEVSDMVFRTDWMFFGKDARRILHVIMRRASLSIEFKSAHVVSMNLEAFVKLLKTSYSAYNVLSGKT